MVFYICAYIDICYWYMYINICQSYLTPDSDLTKGSCFLLLGDLRQSQGQWKAVMRAEKTPGFWPVKQAASSGLHLAVG